MSIVLEAFLLFVIPVLFCMAKLLVRENMIDQWKRRAQLPPGPVPWPVIGCIPEMLQQKPAFRWIHGVMKEMDTEIACSRLGNVHVVPVTCPRIANEFLKRQDAIFASRPRSVAAHTLSGGYITAVMSRYGESWKKMRKVLPSKVVSSTTHQWLHDKRAEEADNLVRYRVCAFALIDL